MMYVFSDGSLSSNGVIDNSAAGRGKGEWTSDNQDTAAAFFLVYNPARAAGAAAHGRRRHDGRAAPAARRVLGGRQRQRSGTPGANNVNLLVETVLLNYMALHGEQGQFADAVPEPRPRRHRASSTGSSAFAPIVERRDHEPVVSDARSSLAVYLHVLWTATWPRKAG